MSVFGTSGIRGPVGETVTAQTALAVGRALASDGADRVVVGRDPRETGSMLVDAVSAGLRECGADVIDVGVAATPTIARGVNWKGADAGVSVTASHNPPQDNGLKLWNPSGMAFDTAQRAQISDRVTEGRFDLVGWTDVGACRRWEGADARHVAAITDAVEPPADPPHVIVDVGTGAGGVTVDALRALGCHVETLNEGPDGAFPARPSEPTAEHCTTLQATVANTDADLGVAHDGDADRLMAVDETGTFLAGDVLLALFAQASDADRVVMPVNTSLAVADALDIEPAYTRVGDVFVAERAHAVDADFGGEPSGAWIWPAETLCPDGPLAAAKLVTLVAQEGPLSALADTIESYPIRRESHAVAEKTAIIEAVASLAAEQYDAIDDRDGVRIEFEDGWLLLRASGTEPVVRLTAEARAASRADDLLQRGRALLERAQELID